MEAEAVNFMLSIFFSYKDWGWGGGEKMISSLTILLNKEVVAND